MKIIRYNGINDITIEFQDEYNFTTNTYYYNFKIGQIKNPYDKTMAGVGYIGVGKHKTGMATKKNNSYTAWEDMLYRCYNEKLRHSHLSYAGCTVCDEWHNYQIFADWYEENFYTVGEGRTHIDKDILYKNNKTYSPFTCIFVPQRINMIFMKKNRKIDIDLPTGIRRSKNGFSSSYNGKHLGTFKNLIDALYFYNIEKKIHINKVAEDFKEKIPYKLYNALLNWDYETII